MLLDILGRVAQSAQALVITIPTDNALGKLYVLLDLLSKLWLLATGAEGDVSILPL